MAAVKGAFVDNCSSSGFHCINCQLHRIDCCCEAFNQALVLAFCVFAIEADKFGCFVPIGVPVSTLSESYSFLVSTCRSEGGAYGVHPQWCR
jgi:hypothetical protein